MKLTIDGRLDAMEDSVAGLATQIRAMVTKGQVSTKHELLEEQELSDGHLPFILQHSLSSHQEPPLQ